MNLQKINVKLFAELRALPLTVFIDVFNGWVQAADGEYYDIADYSHVPEGPGIVLIADEANISMECRGNRLGLLYNRKRPLEGNTQQKLRRVFKNAVEFGRRLEAEPALQGKIRFSGNEALIVINDRLSAPNIEKTFDALLPDVRTFARSLFGDAEITIENEKDSKKRLSFLLKTNTSIGILDLASKLESL